MKKLVLFLVLWGSSLSAQNLSSGRSIDWSTAGAGTIPLRTVICATLTSTATSTDVNNAIAACPANQVVLFSDGTYTLNSGLAIRHSNVTIRGSSPNGAIINFNGGDSCTGEGANVCIAPGSLLPNSDNPGTVANWLTGFAKNTTSISLSTVSGLAVGSMMVLDQLDDTNTDTGELWICQAGSICATDGGSAGRVGRAQMQFVRVTAISGTTVTFTPGLHMPNWRIGRTPQAWWISPITGIGIENLTFNHAGSGTSVKVGAIVFNSYNVWFKNIKSTNGNRNHIWLDESAHVTVRDSYFYGTLNSSSQSYGVETWMGGDHLIENNIFQHITTPMMNGNTTGTVWGYNYALDDYFISPITWQQSSSYFHDAGVDNVLFEGNDGIGFTADNIHGTSNFGTAFRNYWNGKDIGKTQQTSPVIIYSSNRFMNLIGNVLGTVGFHTNYECAPISTSTSTCSVSANTSIYSIGWSGNEGSKDSILLNDLLVKTNMFRWGNFDTVTNTSRFVNAEVPSTAAFYPQTIPPNNSLVSSLYLSTQPSWYNSSTWPSIGPDITTGSLMSGHVIKIPARVCFENTTATGGILNFDANTCYSSSVPPPITGTKQPKLSNSSASVASASVCTLANSGFLDIYNGTKPLTADTAITTQVKLAGLTFAATACSGTVNGVSTFNAIGSDASADATGTPTWFRAYRADHVTVVFDGSVCNSGCDINLSAPTINVGNVVTVNSFTFTASK